MTSDFKKLGIIAGGGTIPKMLIEHCQKLNRPFFVLAIEGNADKALIDGSVPHLWIRIGQAGTGFKKLHDEKVEEVIMIGTIKRPSFLICFRICGRRPFCQNRRQSAGRHGILRALVREIEAEGMTVRGVHEVMSGLLVRKGCLTKNRPDKQAEADIRRGVEVALALGRLDVGQAAVVQQGLVLAVEGIEGTDELLRRSGGYKRKGAGGVLVKLRKPQQDMRIDLPTVGLQTVKRAKESGLRGIAVHAGNGLIVDEAEVVRLADKEGLFVIGVDPSDYAE